MQLKFMHGGKYPVMYKQYKAQSEVEMVQQGNED